MISILLDRSCHYFLIYLKYISFTKSFFSTKGYKVGHFSQVNDIVNVNVFFWIYFSISAPLRNDSTTVLYPYFGPKNLSILSLSDK